MGNTLPCDRVSVRIRDRMGLVLAGGGEDDQGDGGVQAVSGERTEAVPTDADVHADRTFTDREHHGDVNAQRGDNG